MAGRIRSVKPEWLEDERMSAASVEARLLSIALLLLADDHGRGRAHPSHVGLQVFPNDPNARETAGKALAELVAIEFITIYVVRGQTYFAVRNWARHQRVDKPGAPRVPHPSEADAAPTLPTPAPTMETPAISQIREAVASDSRDVRDDLATDLRSPISDLDHRSPIRSAGAVGGVERETLGILRDELGDRFEGIPDPAAVALQLLQAARVVRDGAPDRREVIRHAARAVGSSRGKVRNVAALLHAKLAELLAPGALERHIAAITKAAEDDEDEPGTLGNAQSRAEAYELLNRPAGS